MDTLSAWDGCPTYSENQSRCHSFIGHDLGPYFTVSEIRDFTPEGNGIVSGNPVTERWNRELSIKTNLLGWGLAIANAAVEIDICKQLSFNLPVYYSSWNYFTPTVKFRTLAVQPEIRWWFSRNRNFYAGIHGGIGWYNFALNGEYRFQDKGWDYPALGGGIGFGYRVDIADDGRWKMEFTLGGGAYSVRYDKFRNKPDGMLVGSAEGLWYGIDNASVSFIYSIDFKRRGR